MYDFTDNNPRLPQTAGGVTTRASTNALDDTTQPAITSGFGAVIEKEQRLLRATEDSLDQPAGQYSVGLDRILRHQLGRLWANIALIEQRYEALPSPDRFVNWHARSSPPAAERSERQNQSRCLADLASQHTRLLTDIEALIIRSPDGQRGELILNEVSQNHEEMAWMLTALVKDDESAQRTEHDRNGGRTEEAIRAQQNWDNEGGCVRTEAPAN